jgi:quercetin dioxygenase-like cupin family protein
MKRYKLDTLPYDASCLIPDLLAGRAITGGGVYVFEPGETVHPERHVHGVDELFIFVKGRGTLPVEGVVHAIETGDVVLIEKGEDHHTTSSREDPLVSVWYLFGR